MERSSIRKAKTSENDILKKIFQKGVFSVAEARTKIGKGFIEINQVIKVSSPQRVDAFGIWKYLLLTIQRCLFITMCMTKFLTVKLTVSIVFNYC